MFTRERAMRGTAHAPARCRASRSRVWTVAVQQREPTTQPPARWQQLCRHTLAAVLPFGAAVCLSATSAVAPLPSAAHMMQPAGSTPPTCLATDPADRANVYGDLSGFHHDVVTLSPEAQKLFNQGLLLEYNFNQYEASRSFQAATKADPDCAMCWWGVAYSAGPFANKAAAPVPPDESYPVFSPDELATARSALERAKAALNSPGYQKALKGKYLTGGQGWQDELSGREASYISAMEARYAGGSEGPEWEAAERKYVRAMEQISAGTLGAGDADALAMAAEGLMNLTAWDFGLATGVPNEEARQAQRLLVEALSWDPDHPLAAHLYIHLTEIVPGRGAGTAGQAEQSADILSQAYPAMNHLTHMASHNYLRVGRWHDAVIASRAAVAVDRADAARCLVPYSPQHDLTMLVYGASMGGELGVAEQGARELRGLEGTPGREIVMDEGRDWAALPLQWIRYAQWDRLAADDAPVRPDDLGGEYQAVMQRYVQLMAAAAQMAGSNAGSISGRGTLDEMSGKVDELARAAEALPEDPRTKPGLGLGIYSGGWKLRARTATEVAKARLAVLAGDWENATAALTKAVAVEGSAGYFEPPRHYQPIRQCLGWVMLQQGKVDEAIQVYQEDLHENPANPWSLMGLKQAYTAAAANAGPGSGAAAEYRQLAADAGTAFDEAWQHADPALAKLPSSCPSFSTSAQA